MPTNESDAKTSHDNELRWRPALWSPANLRRGQGITIRNPLGLVQTMIMGGLFYLAALAVIARAGTGESPAPPGSGPSLPSARARINA